MIFLIGMASEEGCRSRRRIDEYKNESNAKPGSDCSVRISLQKKSGNERWPENILICWISSIIFCFPLVCDFAGHYIYVLSVQNRCLCNAEMLFCSEMNLVSVDLFKLSVGVLVWSMKERTKFERVRRAPRKR